MAKSDDFERVGNLLGDACEAVALPTPRGSDGQMDRQRRSKDMQTGERLFVGGPPAAKTPRDPARMLVSAWPEIAGPEIASNARPIQLKRGRLLVSTASAAWAHTLQYMAEGLRARLNERIGNGVVQEIVFRHAGWEERSREGQGPHTAAGRSKKAALSDDEIQALARLEELDLPGEIRDRIARAMEAAFVRGEQDSVR
jgi:hypothetical protein